MGGIAGEGGTGFSRSVHGKSGRKEGDVEEEADDREEGGQGGRGTGGEWEENGEEREGEMCGNVSKWWRFMQRKGGRG